MEHKEFEILLRNAKLTKSKFAELVSMNPNSVSNWNKNKEVPEWVKSWLENYIKAKSYEDVKNKVFEIENIKE